MHVAAEKEDYLLRWEGAEVVVEAKPETEA